jgi:DNA-binding transcriptional LysR family regulator
MRIPNVTVDMMIAVIALAKKEKLRLAAKELGLTSSAIHKRIQAANRLAGTRLFVNTSDGFRLTEEGEVFYAHATRAVEHVLLTEEATAACVRLKERHLLIGHSTYLPSKLLALIHDPHFASGLGIRVEHKAGLTMALARDAAEGTLHAGIGFLPINHPALLSYQISEEPIVVCIPNRHRLAMKATVHPEDIEGEPIIAASRATFPILHEQIDDFFAGFGIRLNIVADAFGPPEAVRMVEQGMGISLLAASNARASMAVKPLSPQTLTRKCGLFLREDNRHPALKAFVDLLLAKTGYGAKDRDISSFCREVM